MSAARTYLDYNATAPLRPEARAALIAALDAPCNASSVHAEGRRARALLDKARGEVASLVGAEPADVTFTSGATEAANWVLSLPWATIVSSPIEHPCIAAPIEKHMARKVPLTVGSDGLIDLALLAATLAAAPRDAADSERSALLVVQHANNETGVVQPIENIAALAKAHGFALLVDAVQSAGRLPIDAAKLAIDYVMVASHKIGGPPGVGALVARRDAPPLAPLLVGGGQERGRRAGTENVAAIAGFGAAASAAAREIAGIDRLRQLRDLLEAGLRRASPETVVIAALAPRLPNTSLVALAGTRAETLVIALDLAGIAASAGAACASGKTKRSGVLDAMGVPGELAEGAVRFSLGWASTESDIEACIEAWLGAVKSRRPALRVA